MKDKILAAIDIGTNTFRLLIAKIYFNPNNNNYSIKEICSQRIITRLGEGIHNNSLLTNEAIERSINTLNKFSNIISNHNVYMTSAVATSALREAKNSDIFIKKVKNATGLDIKIITGQEEAEITSSGMLIDIKIPKTGLMIDIGGGSTEIIFIKPSLTFPTPFLMQSLNLGVVYLAGEYMKNNPPGKEELDQMEAEISQKIMSVLGFFIKDLSSETVFIGTAGTVTSLAAMTQNLKRFDHNKIHGFKLSRDNVRNIFSTISTLSSKERVKYIPFEIARVDIIVPGTLILLKLMEIFGFNEITVSNYGLREGILINLFKKLQ